MKIRSLQDVVDADLCAGCGICEAISGHSRVEMRLNSEGFYRPLTHWPVDDSAWREIRQVCPGVALRQDRNLDTRANEILWGPVQYTAVGHATDEEMRWRASSGGVLSAILVYLLESGRANCVLHIGVCGSDPFIPSACLSRTRKDVIERSGSRYVPTAPLVNLVDLLNKDRAKFAFVGKPCDIAALRSYMNLHPEARSRIVALLSFFCAGVPSIFATYDLVQKLGLQKERVSKFRYRGFGWPGRATAIDLDGQEYSMSYNDSWGKILGKQLQLRCKICPDGIGEFADLVCGDAWHTKDGYPDFEERPGRSLILCRTAKGADLLQAAHDAGYVHTEPLNISKLGEIQPYQKKRRQAIAVRLLALRLMHRPVPTYQGFNLWRNAWSAGLPFLVRQFFGMLHRLWSK